MIVFFMMESFFVLIDDVKLSVAKGLFFDSGWTAGRRRHTVVQGQRTTIAAARCSSATKTGVWSIKG